LYSNLTEKDQTSPLQDTTISTSLPAVLKYLPTARCGRQTFVRI